MLTRNAMTSSSTGLAAEMQSQGLLRVLTCGSVDDGKSTLIGRLLYDSKRIYDDQLRSLENDSRKYGTTGDDIDLALLVDGLESEREQGITIDVAYRYFASSKRSYIIADTPGHEQYTRNMVTGASTSDLAILLIDARKGLLPQTHRHSIICSMLGIRHVLLAVNKIDLVDFDKATFDRITEAYAAFAARLSFVDVVSIPISARFGDNVTALSSRIDWYRGPTLLDYLDAVQVESDLEQKPFRMPVQWINRPNLDFRGICGTISSGLLRRGDEVVVANSGHLIEVDRILVGDRECEVAKAGEAVTLVAANAVDIGRGDLLAAPDHRPEVSNQYAVNLVWLSEKSLFPGRTYLARFANRFTPATVTHLKYRLEIATMEPLASKTLQLNEIGECNVETTLPIAFDPYRENRETGSCILIDRETNATVGAGMILHGLRRAQNVHSQHFTIDKLGRAHIKDQKPCILWFTGLSGSGKSTIANLVEQHLHRRGYHTMSLDGDNFRHGLNRDLGFTPEDRVENIRRAGEVARLMVEAGLIVLCSFISPFRMERRLVRSLVGEDEFIEVFIDTPLDVCIARDPKGLYKRALSGAIPNFTGISAPYEAPEHPEIVLQTDGAIPQTLADRLIDMIEIRKIIK